MRRVAAAFALALGCGAWLGACGGSEVVVVPTQLTSASVDVTKLQSYELWVLDQVGRDNNPISCDALLKREILPASANVVALKDPIDGDFSDGAHVKVSAVRRGDKNVILYIDVFSLPGQLGDRVAAGCAPAVTITGGKTLAIELDVDTPPAAMAPSGPSGR